MSKLIYSMVAAFVVGAAAGGSYVHFTRTEVVSTQVAAPDCPAPAAGSRVQERDFQHRFQPDVFGPSGGKSK